MSVCGFVCAYNLLLYLYENLSRFLSLNVSLFFFYLSPIAPTLCVCVFVFFLALRRGSVSLNAMCESSESACIQPYDTMCLCFSIVFFFFRFLWSKDFLEMFDTFTAMNQKCSTLPQALTHANESEPCYTRSARPIQTIVDFVGFALGQIKTIIWTIRIMLMDLAN